MDPATQALLLTYGIPIATAVLGVLLKHFFPTLGNSVLPGVKPSPAANPVVVSAVSSIIGRQHPLLQRLLASPNGQAFMSELLQGAESGAGGATASPQDLFSALAAALGTPAKTAA
jgi:hypothetical protein